VSTAAREDAPRPEQLPVFFGDDLTRIHDVIEWVHAAVRKTHWEPERVRDRYLRRSLAEILSDGDTLVVGPCPDRTAIATVLLHHHEIPFELVIHERQIAGYGPPTVHMALEFDTPEGGHWCDFGFRETRFMAGRYDFDQSIEETIQITRFASADFDPFALSLEQAFELIAPQQAQLEAKVGWFCSQLETVTPEMLEERIAYEPDQSVYWNAIGTDHDAPSPSPSPGKPAPR
jgi:hypothetical protein